MPTATTMRQNLAPPSHDNDYIMDDSDQYDQWLFTDEELVRTPSILKNGVTVQQEREGRSKGCNFILQVGIKLKLPQLTLATASVFLHRFFMRESLKDFHYYNVAATALYLATKVEENCRKLSDLIQAVARTAQKNDQIIIDEQSKEYWKWHDTIMFTEEYMLAALCYDFNVEKPYKLLQDYLQLIKVESGGMKEKDIMKVAWAFINDSHLTVLCLMFPASTIAGAALYMSAKFNDTVFKDGKGGQPWWEVIGLNLLDIKKACNQMADLYENNPLRNADGKYPTTPETEDTNSNRTRSSLPSTKLTYEGHESVANSNGTSVQDAPPTNSKLPDTSQSATTLDDREEGEFEDDDDREEGEL